MKGIGNVVITKAEMVFLGDILNRLTMAVDVAAAGKTIVGAKRGPKPGVKRGRPGRKPGRKPGRPANGNQE